MTRGGDTAPIRATWRGRRRSAASWRDSLALIAVTDLPRLALYVRVNTRPAGGPSPVSARGPAREAPGHRGHCRVGLVEQFRRAADGSRRSAPTARRWTSSRASGSAMANSSQVRSRADRKTHMLSVLSSSPGGRPSRPTACGTSSPH